MVELDLSVRGEPELRTGKVIISRRVHTAAHPRGTYTHRISSVPIACLWKCPQEKTIKSTKADVNMRGSTHMVPTSGFQAGTRCMCMKLTLRATPHGAPRLVRGMSAWSVVGGSPTCSVPALYTGMRGSIIIVFLGCTAIVETKHLILLRGAIVTINRTKY